MAIILNGTTGITTPADTVTGNASVGGTLNVTGATTLASATATSLSVGGVAAVAVAPSTVGNVLTSNGTAWVSSAPASSGITSGTAVSASGSTSIDFTGIPSTAKRITVMLTNVGNPSSNPQIQLGTSGGFVTSGYQNDIAGCGSGGAGGGSQTTGHALAYFSGSYTWTGVTVFDLIGSNVWVGTGIARYTTGQLTMASSYIALSGALDRIRYTTLSGAVTFSSGTINIFWE